MSNWWGADYWNQVTLGGDNPWDGVQWTSEKTNFKYGSDAIRTVKYGSNMVYYVNYNGTRVFNWYDHVRWYYNCTTGSSNGMSAAGSTNSTAYLRIHIKNNTNYYVWCYWRWTVSLAYDVSTSTSWSNVNTTSDYSSTEKHSLYKISPNTSDWQDYWNIAIFNSSSSSWWRSTSFVIWGCKDSSTAPSSNQGNADGRLIIDFRHRKSEYSDGSGT